MIRGKKLILLFMFLPVLLYGQDCVAPAEFAGRKCFVVLNNDSLGAGSFPYVLEQANNADGPAYITFSSSLQRIDIRQSSFSIINDIVIDGTPLIVGNEQLKVILNKPPLVFHGTNYVNFSVSGLHFRTRDYWPHPDLMKFEKFGELKLKEFHSWPALYPNPDKLNNYNYLIYQDFFDYRNMSVLIEDCKKVNIVASRFNMFTTMHLQRASLKLSNIETVEFFQSYIAGGVKTPLPLSLTNIGKIKFSETYYRNNVSINYTQEEYYPVYFNLSSVREPIPPKPVFNDQLIKATGTLSGTAFPDEVVEIFSVKEVMGNQGYLEILEFMGSVKADNTGKWILQNLAEGAKLEGGKLYTATGTINGQTSGFSTMYRFLCPGISFDPINICSNSGVQTLWNLNIKEGYTLKSIKAKEPYPNSIYNNAEVYFFDPGGVNGEVTLSLKMEVDVPYKNCPVIDGTIKSSLAPSISGLPPTICPQEATKPITLSVMPSGGQLSISEANSTTSKPIQGGFTPSDYNAGTKTVTYTPGNSSPCPPVKAHTFIYEKPVPLNDVISASAITFSDAWPLDHYYSTSSNKINLNNLSSGNPLLTGNKGIWRTEDVLTYVNDRQRNVDPANNLLLHSSVKSGGEGSPLLTSGTMNQVPMYDWSNAGMNACFPEWRKLESMQEYTSAGYATEEKDAIDRPSAALYGYKSNLIIAQVHNALKEEICYESFEEYDADQNIYDATQTEGGGFTFFNDVVFRAHPRYHEYEIVSGDGPSITILATEDPGLAGKKIKVYGASFSEIVNGKERTSFNNKNIYDEFEVLTVENVGGGQWRLLLTGRSNSVFPYTGLWKGRASLYLDNTGTFVIPAKKITLDSAKAHTGKLSLAFEESGKFEQEYMHLNPGKRYVISAWVSADEKGHTFKSGPSEQAKRGLQLSFKTAGSEELISVLAEPAGDIIEGWQKIETEFYMPSEAKALIVKFQVPGGKKDYYDDIRIHPVNASMQTYVYDKTNLRLNAVLDQNNYATLYYYDQEGNLFLVKKETERGIMTVQETYGHQKERE